MSRLVIALGPIDLQTLIAKTYDAIHETKQHFHRILLELEIDEKGNILEANRPFYYPVDGKYHRIGQGKSPVSNIGGLACPYPPRCTDIKFSDAFTDEKFADCIKQLDEKSKDLKMK